MTAGRRSGAVTTSRIFLIDTDSPRDEWTLSLDARARWRLAPNLIPTGETLAQVQNRLLPIGATINGVFVADNNTAVPLFTEVKSYTLFGVRGSYRFNQHSEVFVDFENIFDKSYRGISWGVDGAGRGVTLRYRYEF